MRANVSTVEPSPALSGVPGAGQLRLRPAQAGEINHLFRLPECLGLGQRELEREPDAAQGRLPHGPRPGSPMRRFQPIRVRAHPGGRSAPRPVSPRHRVHPPSQRRPGRQPAREPRTLDETSTIRNPGQRRARLGAQHPDALRGARITSNSAHGTRALSTLGGGGNRTRVLRRKTRASPGASCCAFLGPGGHTGKPPTGPAAVGFPARPRCRVVRWSSLADVSYRTGSAPGLTAPLPRSGSESERVIIGAYSFCDGWFSRSSSPSSARFP